MLVIFSDVQQKINELVDLYDDIKTTSQDRNQALEDTLEVSDRFWDDLNNLMGTLKELQDTLANQDPVALEPTVIREQQEVLEVRGFERQ